MKNKKVLIISISSFLLILMIGVSYSLYNFDFLGINNQLLLGDIYINYKENNQLKIDEITEQNEFYYYKYQVNPVMKKQSLSNELTRCLAVTYGVSFDEGSDPESFCRGYGTLNGSTFQEIINDLKNQASQNGFDFLYIPTIRNIIDLSVLLHDGNNYIVNPIMKTQEVEEPNELMKCINFSFMEYVDSFDEGSTYQSFCRGTGTIEDGVLFQDILDAYWYSEESMNSLVDANFVNKVFLGYYNYYVVSENITDEMVNKCVDLMVNFYGPEEEYYLYDGESYADYCNGTGTFWGESLDDDVYAGDFFSSQLAELSKIGMIEQKKYEMDLPYFEFTIKGKNTYDKKDIWYDISLSHGDSHETRTTRIRDDLLRFILVEVEDDENLMLIGDKKYSDLTNQRIWVDVVPRNTNKKIEKTYRLYMYFTDDIKIGQVRPDSDITIDYDFDTWNDIFASIKVNVNGDFVEKTIDDSCFKTTLNNNELTITDFDESCGRAVVVPTKIGDYNVTTISTNSFYGKYLTKAVIPFGIKKIERNSFGYNNITEVTIPDSVTSLDCLAFDSKVTINKRDDLTCSLEKTNPSCFTTKVVDDEIVITDYDKYCGDVVVISDTINGKQVTKIDENAFYSKGLTMVVLPNTLKKIERNSFGYNNITEVIIPDSVTSLECSAFDDFVVIDKRDELVCSNSFTDESCFTTQVSNGEIIITDYDKSCGVVVTIPNYIDNKPVVTIDEIAFKSKELIRLNLPNYLKKISKDAFINNSILQVTIPTSVTILDCSAFDDFVEINKNNSLVCNNTTTPESCFTTTFIQTIIHPASTDEEETTNGVILNPNMTEDELNVCIDFFQDRKSFDYETARKYCRGEEVEYYNNFQYDLTEEWYDIDEFNYFIENNIVLLNGTKLAITDYNADCGSDVVIPKTINGGLVTGIKQPCFEQPVNNKTDDGITNNLLNQDFNTKYGNRLVYTNSCGASFKYSGLTSVFIPNTVESIGENAFSGNLLNEVIFEDNSNLLYIYNGAFRNNQLKDINLPNGLKQIYSGAFRDNLITEVNVPNSVTYLGCAAFDYDVIVNTPDGISYNSYCEQ